MHPGQRIRSSDAEREATIAVLQTAAADGRLTLEEFDDRSRWAVSSTTRDELAALVADLPVAPMQWAPGQWAPPWVSSPMEPPQQASQLALLALFFGVMALPMSACLPFGGALGLAGVVCGAAGLRRIRAGAQGSKGMARAGIICGSIGLALDVAFLVVLSLPNDGSINF
jgi:hypothetical protein